MSAAIDSEFEGEEGDAMEEEDIDEEELLQAAADIEETIKVEQPDYQMMLANRNQKRKKKEAREADKDEPLYCFCQQVSYGEMVACDGEVI